ncbi:MAG: MarR family transcriptional regulator [Burkholderiales bacterium]|jgi:DNA-binding MarR family transcriptional regulator|nr:MarR family transcriptional regulator [Burkholderiales bacterium]
MSAAETTDTSVDRESRVKDTDHDALRLWLRLLTCTNLVEGAIRSELRQSFDCTLPRFDLMAQLERHPEGLRMGELSRRMMVTGGNVTGITDQLVKEGLVTREAPPDDRRAFVVRLTPAGRKSFQRMAQAHEAWIVELFAALPASERRQLYALLAKLKTGLLAATRQADEGTEAV